MSGADFRRCMGHVNSWLLVLVAFCLPISTTATSIAALLCVLGWALGGDYRRKLAEIAANPMSRAVLAYVAVLLAGLTWNEQLAESLNGIHKQWKILLMPFFLGIIRPKQRRLVLWAFIAGMALMTLSTFLAWFGLIRYTGVPPEQLTRKTYHVVYNPMLALAIYLVLHQLIWTRLRQRWMRPALVLLTILMLTSMFMTDGRTGQMAVLILLGLYFFQYFQGSRWKAALALVLVPVLVFCASYKISSTFRGRIEQARQEIAIFNHNPRTSVGQRLFFWQQSLQIFCDAPLLGVGTGGFAPAYAEHNRTYTPYMPPSSNPHSQYILALVQGGLLGLAALLGLFVTQFYLALKSKDEWGRLRLAFPLFFLVIMLTESYLLIHETGILFSLFAAVLYKEDRPEGGGRRLTRQAAPGPEPV